MRKYETIVVFDPNLSGEVLDGQIANISQFIKQRGGEDLAIDDWGKREIAYTVKKRNWGIFRCFKFTSNNTDLTNDLTASLRINDAVLKFQSHKLSDKVRKFKGNLRGGDSLEEMDLSYQ